MSKQEKIREKRKNAIVSRVVSVIGSGKLVAISGWRDSNHDDFTRKIPQNLVIFWEEAPKKIPKNVEYVIFTRFVKHKQTERVGKNTSIHPTVLQTGQIREVLSESLKIYGGLG